MGVKSGWLEDHFCIATGWQGSTSVQQVFWKTPLLPSKVFASETLAKRRNPHLCKKVRENTLLHSEIIVFFGKGGKPMIAWQFASKTPNSFVPQKFSENPLLSKKMLRRPD